MLSILVEKDLKCLSLMSLSFSCFRNSVSIEVDEFNCLKFWNCLMSTSEFWNFSQRDVMHFHATQYSTIHSRCMIHSIANTGRAHGKQAVAHQHRILVAMEPEAHSINVVYCHRHVQCARQRRECENLTKIRFRYSQCVQKRTSHISRMSIKVGAKSWKFADFNWK